MKKRAEAFIGFIVVCVLVIPQTVVVGALSATPDVLITELQTSNTTASEEFIELYNTTDHDIDLADSIHQGKDIWKIQFFSSTKVVASSFNWDPTTSGLTTLNLVHSDGSPVVLSAHSYFLISTTVNNVPYTPGNTVPNLTYSTGRMSDAGGGVQLVDVAGTGTTQVITVHDHLGWFTPTTAAPLPNGFYLTPTAGSSLQRAVNQAGSYLMDNGNFETFVESPNPSPKSVWAPPIDPSIMVLSSADDNQVVSDAPPDQSVSVESDAEQPIDPNSPQPSDFLQPAQITELLPNPAAPQTDDKDEYVELFNPNDQSLDLGGYTIQTGLKFAYSYTILGLVMAPTSYTILTSGNTKLSRASLMALRSSIWLGLTKIRTSRPALMAYDFSIPSKLLATFSRSFIRSAKFSAEILRAPGREALMASTTRITKASVLVASISS